jgi:glucosamine-6-phosphate deaminase
MKPIFETKVDDLPVSVYPTNKEMGMAAAEEAAAVIKKAIQSNGHTNIIIATGNSQLTFLVAVGERGDVDWSRINVFHMDEYVGIAEDHPASFPLFLRRHIIDRVKPRNFYPIIGQTKNPEEICRQYE